jgi:membrane-associated protein
MESIYELFNYLRELLNPKNIIDFLTTKGLLLTYFGLILIVFAETGLAVGFFLPGDSLLVVAGLVARMHPDRLNVVVLLGTLFVAAVVGDAVGYYTGLKLGPRLFTRQKSLLFRPSHLQKAHEFYEKYGGKTIIIARFVPIVRTFAPFVAGLGSMSYGRFMSYNVIGGVAWVLICTIAGYLFGNLPFVQENFSLVVLAIIFLSVLPAVWEIWRARQAGRRARQA